MSNLPRSTRLLKRVTQRLRIASWGRSLYLSVLIVCGVYAAGLLIGRLLGVLPNDVFAPLSLCAVPVVALLLSLLLSRRVTPVEAARRIDRHGGTKDLFLSVTLIDPAEPNYGPLVQQAAEEKAAALNPAEVVPFWWARQLGSVLAAGLLLAAGVFYLPQLDPFGKVAAAQEEQQRHQQLAKSKKATLLRATQLKKDDSGDQESKQVEKAIEELKSTFRQSKPKQKRQNFKKLAGHQKNLGQKWRKLSAEKLKDLLNVSARGQQFGGAGEQKLKMWTRELQQGSTDSLKKELDSIKQNLQKLAKTDDPVKKAELQQKLKKRLRDLEEFASKRSGSPELTAALKRAMKQLEMAKSDQLSTEALEAAAQSVDLAKLELQEIAQTAKELKQLEEALKTLQMAKKLNENEKLDGEACAGCQSLGDYAELYAQMMGQMGGRGPGMRGPGFGEGGEAPEDDSAATDFRTERSRTATTAGKVLLSLKTKGLSDTGEARKEYQQQLRKVQQGISEAILQEQIPPGYHEGIKQYFDTIDNGLEPDTEQ